MRSFNVTGLCVPEEDYMVDLSGKIAQVRELIDERRYFTINRARQYGKTTMLAALRRALADKYTVASISFEGLGDSAFSTEKEFCAVFIKQVGRAFRNVSANEDFIRKWESHNASSFVSLSEHITELCKDRKVVLMIDEVDKTSNNRVFLHFLSMLRDKFLSRKNGDDYTFHSVILAGVYDIRNIKLKMVEEGSYSPGEGENKIFNSPWNIAVSFDVDMSFRPDEIAGMLKEYDGDHNTGMDIATVSVEIFKYTSGYPFMVSRLCQCIDKELGGNWTADGVEKAVMVLVQEKNVLFDDLAKNLENNRELYDFMYALLILGERKSFVVDVPVVGLSTMFGYITKGNGNSQEGQSGYAAISNKVFEMRMSNYFIAKDENATRMDNAVCEGLYRDVVKGGRFDMELCLRKFAEHYTELFSGRDVGFLERHGRLLFLSYLKPIVNGRGFYHIESQFTDLRRMDIVVDFGRQQFIVELKIWRGAQYQAEAYEQLVSYLNSKNSAEGYLLTFDFRKELSRERTMQWRETGGKRIFEVVV